MVTLCIISFERPSSHPAGKDGMEADGLVHLVHLLLPFVLIFLFIIDLLALNKSIIENIAIILIIHDRQDFLVLL